MGVKEYVGNCEGCRISKGQMKDGKPWGGIIELPGDWILNHYGGEEGFLGWLALQPRYHIMELSELSADEASALGQNIQNIDLALRQYWCIRFPNDPIQRVYVVYFFESVFDEPPKNFHLHIHLIPRTKKLRPLLKDQKAKDQKAKVVAWDIYKLHEHSKFPRDYQIKPDNDENKKKVEALVTYLRGQLWRTPR